MSVINKVLRDLDQRQATPPGAGAGAGDGADPTVGLRSGTSTVESAAVFRPNRTRPGLLWQIGAAVSLGIAGLAGAGWWWQTHKDSGLVANQVVAAVATQAAQPASAAKPALAASAPAGVSSAVPVAAPASVPVAAGAEASTVAAPASAPGSVAVPAPAPSSVAGVVPAPAPAAIQVAASAPQMPAVQAKTAEQIPAPAAAAPAPDPSTALAVAGKSSTPPERTPEPGKRPAAPVAKDAKDAKGQAIAKESAKQSATEKAAPPKRERTESSPAGSTALRMERSLSMQSLAEPSLAYRSGKASASERSSANAPANASQSAAATQSATEVLAQAQSLWTGGNRDAAIDLLRDAVAVAERAAPAGTGANGDAVLLPLVRELTRMQVGLARHAAVWDLLTRLEPLLGNQPDLWAIRANTAQRLGRHQDSVHSYMAALQSRPTEQRWLLGAAVSLTALGQLSSAAEMAERARAVGPISKEVQSYLRQMGVAVRE
ncbi:MAG: hypothetical protein K9K38_20545 [Rhodoferax sp.]|nr:hypothetical protein [Rhodoferax sp.]